MFHVPHKKYERSYYEGSTLDSMPVAPASLDQLVQQRQCLFKEKLYLISLEHKAEDYIQSLTRINKEIKLLDVKIANARMRQL